MSCPTSCWTRPPKGTSSPRCAPARPISRSGQGAEQKDAAREKARDEARKKLEDEATARATAPKPLPEFGSAEDFQLTQALNRLKGKQVLVSKTLVERKAEADTHN